MNLPIVRPDLPDLPKFSAAFAKCLTSGQVTNNGVHVLDFEAELTDHLGVQALAFSSGTAALLCLLKAVGVRDGNVVVPAFTFPATIAAIEWAGARPKFVDIDPKTLTIDPGLVEAACDEETTAILGVDVYGICCNYARLIEIGRKVGVPVIFDSAPAFGSKSGNELTGSWGDGQIFSFHATKPFTTMEGGCLTSNRPEVIEWAEQFRNFGLARSGRCVRPGINGKMLEVCAIIGQEQLRDWPGRRTGRRIAAGFLAKLLRRIDGIRLLESPPGQEPVWTYRPVLVDTDSFGLPLDGIRAALQAFGIETRRYYPACNLEPAWSDPRVRLPITEDVAARVISLPVYNTMTREECLYIRDALLNIRNSRCE